MAMAIDEARNEDHVGGIDHLCAFARQSCADRGDLAALDQHITLGKIPDFRVHADDRAALQKKASFGIDRPKLFEAAYRLALCSVDITHSYMRCGKRSKPSTCFQHITPSQRRTAVHGSL